MDGSETEEPQTTSEFAYERDLRNFLANNLGIIESGLQLYQEEGITGIEFPAGGYASKISLYGSVRIVSEPEIIQHPLAQWRHN